MEVETWQNEEHYQMNQTNEHIHQITLARLMLILYIFQFLLLTEIHLQDSNWNLITNWIAENS